VNEHTVILYEKTFLNVFVVVVFSVITAVQGFIGIHASKHKISFTNHQRMAAVNGLSWIQFKLSIPLRCLELLSLRLTRLQDKAGKKFQVYTNLERPCCPLFCTRIARPLHFKILAITIFSTALQEDMMKMKTSH
jgi:hypothetical protein